MSRYRHYTRDEINRFRYGCYVVDLYEEVDDHDKDLLMEAIGGYPENVGSLVGQGHDDRTNKLLRELEVRRWHMEVDVETDEF